MFSLHFQPLVIGLKRWLELAQTTLVQTKLVSLESLRSLFRPSGHRIDRVAQTLWSLFGVSSESLQSLFGVSLESLRSIFGVF